MKDRGIGSVDERCRDSMILWPQNSPDAPRDVQHSNFYTVETETGHHIIRPRVEKAGAGRQTKRSFVGEIGASHFTRITHASETGASCLTGITHAVETKASHLTGMIHAGDTKASRRNKSVHLGETWASCPKERPHNGETGAIRFSESSHLGETKSSVLNRLLHLGVSEASFSTGRSHLRETGAICPTRTSYVQETGASCQTRRPHIGETGASWPTQRQHVGENGVGCSIRRSDIRETRASCPIRMQSVGETGIGCPTRMQHIGETGTGCPNGFLHVGETEATHEPKIPIYDGKEDWTVWINRFEAIAGLRRWDEDRKLDCLLPKLHGKVGEYAFAVLPKQILGFYEELVGELNSMFRKVEIPSAIAAEFHNRIQGEDESVEEYAAELRCLYFKAYKHSNKQTREEDLVLRFLYGLRDEEMIFAVEYHKEPVSLDEAIYYAVDYAELRRRVLEGHCIDKEISKQRKEECYQYNKTHNKTGDCCYPEGSHTAIKAVVQRPTYQTS